MKMPRRNLVREYEKMAREGGLDLMPSNSHVVYLERSKPPVVVRRDYVDIPAHIHGKMFGPNKDKRYDQDHPRIDRIMRCLDAELFSFLSEKPNPPWWSVK